MVILGMRDRGLRWAGRGCVRPSVGRARWRCGCHHPRPGASPVWQRRLLDSASSASKCASTAVTSASLDCTQNSLPSGSASTNQPRSNPRPYLARTVAPRAVSRCTSAGQRPVDRVEIEMQPVLHLLGVGDFPERDHRWLIAFRQADPAALSAPFHWTAQYGTPERRQAMRVRAINHQVAHDKAHAPSIAPRQRDLPPTDLLLTRKFETTARNGHPFRSSGTRWSSSNRSLADLTSPG